MPLLRQGRILDPAIETESADDRRARLGARLHATVAHAYAKAPRFRRMMLESGCDACDVRGLDELPRIPILRKDDLPALQAADAPFGGLLAVEPGQLARMFMSPGPIFDPQGTADDFWRFGPALAAAGFRPGDVVHVAASYHLTPLAFMLDSAARSLGCAVIPGGVGQTELQIKAAAHLGATAYLGTPSFLHILLSKARELRTPLRIETAWVIAEMLPESLRAEVESSYGVRVLQGYGTADLGLLAYECAEKGGWHLHPEAIVEVLDLETGEPAAPGQPGEVVATVFDESYPLVRFATGDIGQLAPDAPCPCGRTMPKLAGLLGRVGDAVKVKGLFVRGAQVEAVAKRFPEVARIQAVVTRDRHTDHLAYRVELASGASGERALVERLAEALREVVTVRGEIEVVAPGTIPAAAKRIEDRRSWK